MSAAVLLFLGQQVLNVGLAGIFIGISKSALNLPSRPGRRWGSLVQSLLGNAGDVMSKAVGGSKIIRIIRIDAHQNMESGMVKENMGKG